MKIIAKKKHASYKTLYKFESKKELLEYAKDRKNNVTGALTESEENFIPSNKKTVYELLEFCRLEKIN